MENKAYSNGLEVKSVIDMIEDIALACSGKTEEIRIPDPVNAKALIKTLRVDGIINIQNIYRIHDPDSTHARLKSRRAMAKELRGNQDNSAADVGVLSHTIETKIEAWNNSAL